MSELATRTRNGALTVVDDEDSMLGMMLQQQQASVGTAIQMAAAMLDKRISTARAYPRSITKFKREAAQLLSEDVETARAAEYAKPVGGGVVKGASIRLAELAAMCWGRAAANTLTLTLRYTDNESAIQEIHRVSRPGQRRYAAASSWDHTGS